MLTGAENPVPDWKAAKQSGFNGKNASPLHQIPCAARGLPPDGPISGESVHLGPLLQSANEPRHREDFGSLFEPRGSSAGRNSPPEAPSRRSGRSAPDPRTLDKPRRGRAAFTGQERADGLQPPTARPKRLLYIILTSVEGFM